MALRLKPETREAWRNRLEEMTRKSEAEMAASFWRPVPRSEPEPPEHTDMFIKGYVD